VDLDRFKSINDSLGHIAGDEMLKEVARRLSQLLRKADTLARLGGDEFVLVLNEITGPRDAETVASKILSSLSEPVTLSGLDVQISASIGVSMFPEDGVDAETLLQHADAAMYHAKKNGRSAFQFFAPVMNVFARERLELESGLRRALALRRVRAALPAEGGREQWPDRQCRSPHPLASSEAGADRTERVHSHRGGNGAHRADRRVASRHQKPRLKLPQAISAHQMIGGVDDNALGAVVEIAAGPAVIAAGDYSQ
jgi:diguanylate cyclase (GGDEF)-like protein